MGRGAGAGGRATMGKRGLGGQDVELGSGNPAGNERMENGWKFSVSVENRINIIRVRIVREH